MNERTNEEFTYALHGLKVGAEETVAALGRLGARCAGIVTTRPLDAAELAQGLGLAGLSIRETLGELSREHPLGGVVIARAPHDTALAIADAVELKLPWHALGPLGHSAEVAEQLIDMVWSTGEVGVCGSVYPYEIKGPAPQQEADRPRAVDHEDGWSPAVDAGWTRVLRPTDFWSYPGLMIAPLAELIVVAGLHAPAWSEVTTTPLESGEGFEVVLEGFEHRSVLKLHWIEEGAEGAWFEVDSSEGWLALPTESAADHRPPELVERQCQHFLALARKDESALGLALKELYRTVGVMEVLEHAQRSLVLGRAVPLPRIFVSTGRITVGWAPGE